MAHAHIAKIMGIDVIRCEKGKPVMGRAKNQSVSYGSGNRIGDRGGREPSAFVLQPLKRVKMPSLSISFAYRCTLCSSSRDTGITRINDRIAEETASHGTSR